jgi:hypothetical protein
VSPELVQGVGNRLQWIGVADQALRLDPGDAEMLEACGQAEAGAAPRLVPVG